MAIKIMKRTATTPFPVIGKISKGDEVPTKSGNATRPIDLDYFRFQFAEGYEELAPTVVSIYGDKPRAIEVLLMPVFNHDDAIEMFFPHSMQTWNATRLIIECDGEHTTRVWDDKTQQYDRAPHACQLQADGVCKAGCKWTGRLKVMLPHLVPIVGFHAFTLTTHGKKDIEQIVGALEFVTARNLPIDSIRWSMLRTPARSQFKDANGKMQTRDYYPVSLVMVGVNESLFGNPTQSDAPRLADTHYRADDDVPYGGMLENPYDEGVVIESASQPAPVPANVSIAQAVIAVLAKEHGQNDVQSSDILHLFGVESWDELGQKWTGERTARALATEYMRLFVMKTREF